GALLRSVEDTGSTTPVIQVFEGAAGLQYWARDIAQFWIEPSGAAVWYRVAPGAAAADVEHMLAGPVLGLALQVQGQVQMHAGAVVVDGAAVAFAAPHGFGKSTLAAAFVRAGYPLLSDDVLPLDLRDGACRALHSLPRIKLWGDSLTALGEDEQRYETVLSGYPKRRVTVGRHWGEAAPEGAPLAAVYLLAPHPNPAATIVISDVEPAPAVLQLVGNMYLAETLCGRRAVQALDAAVQLAATTRVRALSYYRGYAELPALMDAIVADVRSRPSRTGAG
ncbi:MAG TPA: hypothetical protein VFA70_02705, partial [Dehalococcoidia bacterium]|nr:hypothetical protein [Dehalococcoidia bacterium]